MLLLVALVSALLAAVVQATPAVTEKSSIISTSLLPSATVARSGGSSLVATNARCPINTATAFSAALHVALSLRKLKLSPLLSSLTFSPGPETVPDSSQTCESLIDLKAAELASELGNPITGYWTNKNWGTLQKQFEWGTIVCLNVASGAVSISE